MNQVSKRRFAWVAAVGLACAALTSAVQATNSWGGYHWARAANPFTLQLGDNLTTDGWKSHLTQTSTNWNNGTTTTATTPPIITPTPVHTKIVPGSSRKRCSMVLGTTQVCNGSYGYNGWLGLASINITGGVHITQGSAKMNDSYFNISTYNNTNEREHVMCQEVAHTFGLDHQSTDGSSQDTCMDYFSNTGANADSALSTTPNQHDFDELAIIYQHLDSTTTVAAVTAEAAAARGWAEVDVNDDPASWGHLISQSPDGRSSTYERYNLDSSVTRTHVYWTIEAAAHCPSCDHRFER